MNIIKASENLSQRDIFKLTTNPGIPKFQDNVGRTITVTAYVIFEDTNRKTGEVQTLLAILTDDGDAMSTISKTVIERFQAMVDMFPLPIEDIEIVKTDTVSSGRSYLNLIMH